jgi:uncharacterized membrane protein YraQ (UPF0718 family)
MGKNAVALPESVTFAPAADQRYRYRHKMGMIPSAEFSVRMEDFVDTWATNVPLGWAAAIIDTGATVVADTTVGYPTGALFDSDGADEGAAVYGTKHLQLTANKRFFMEMRFQTEAAADTTVQFGLTSVTATTNPEDLWTTTATDLVAFGILTGAAVTKLLCDKSNSGSTAETGTLSLVDNTWHTLAIYWDGVNITGWVDGLLSNTWAQAATTIPTGVILAPFFGFLNGTTGAAQEGHCDYVRWVLER